MSQPSDPSAEVLEAGQPANRPTPATRRAPFSRLFGQIVSTLTAGGLITWSVFNLSHNAMLFWAERGEDQNWIMGGLMVILTCVAPLLLGFYLLTKSLDSAPSAKR